MSWVRLDLVAHGKGQCPVRALAAPTPDAILGLNAGSVRGTYEQPRSKPQPGSQMK